jgi:hypothetical protein
VTIGRKSRCQFVERHHRQAIETRLVEIGWIDGKGDDAVRAVMGEVEMREVGDVAGAEHHEINHLRLRGPACGR